MQQGLARPLMLASCLGTELLFASLSFFYIETLTHKLRLLGTLKLTRPLFAVKGAGLPATLWVAVVGLSCVHGWFTAAPLFFVLFFGLEAAAPYVRIDTATTRSSSSKEAFWMFALTGLCGFGVLGTAVARTAL
ncbi:hypothetical protein SPRG_07270 [Saprolegnia parasitica CBS 223.65]|uniref:Uncharacterized protein n=1 Tax=Saprolegnia parasitica (strain CBS 223.65) TaxID=695850 RepID=A0A067CMD6_SAPPC|nr:hypothetical protein SPRG_07270 [Saprolegnia parasitica CBS 223.65]KDO27992.1 hypothetical protein SPRG_07270 [Saprolegnia parasitica CBS 223.65]|eukprot:XP_012201441.1 hypothetical protein SPRG_07270 [Saprolegnia parasitica CBS 223.65]